MVKGLWDCCWRSNSYDRCCHEVTSFHHCMPCWRQSSGWILIALCFSFVRRNCLWSKIGQIAVYPLWWCSCRSPSKLLVTPHCWDYFDLHVSSSLSDSAANYCVWIGPKTWCAVIWELSDRFLIPSAKLLWKLSWTKWPLSACISQVSLRYWATFHASFQRITKLNSPC